MGKKQKGRRVLPRDALVHALKIQLAVPWPIS
jgi:hypothetical protein